MNYRDRFRRRPGNAMVWFALIVWIFVGLGALTIDLGLVRTTQRQMQTLTDEAALEAAYNLDLSAEERQAAAQAAIDASLSDTQAGEPHDYQRFGAGPNITVTGDAYSAPSLTNPSSHDPTRNVYQPALQTNTKNQSDGDIVRGAYSSVATTNNPEASGYDRPDFDTSGTDAVLVRLRRSHEFPTPDGAHSSGSALPYLFGRSTFINPQNKTQGVTVRATTIAAARPTLSVGPIITTAGATVPGVTPFGLTVDYWNTLDFALRTGTIDSTGNITIGAAIVGSFTAPPTTATVIGQPFSAAGATAMAADPTLDLYRYVPLYATVGASGPRVVGFGHLVNVTWDPVAGTISFQKRVAPDSTTTSAMAGNNASTALAGPLDATLAPADVSALFGYVSGSTPTITDPLRAPALVR